MNFLFSIVPPQKVLICATAPWLLIVVMRTSHGWECFFATFPPTIRFWYNPLKLLTAEEKISPSFLCPHAKLRAEYEMGEF